MGKYCRQHIGKTFNDGNLIVVDGGDKFNYLRVKCSVCAKDIEMFGDAVFNTTYGSLNRGIIPCGCAKRFRYSREQCELIIKRKIQQENLQIEFIGFTEGNSFTQISRKPIDLRCLKTNIVYSVNSVDGFLGGDGVDGRINDIDYLIDKFNEDNPNKLIWKTGKKRGHKNIIGYHCSICEQNEFESLYETLHNDLFGKNLHPCMCIDSSSHKDEEYMFNNSVKMLESGNSSGVLVLGMIKKYTKNTSNWYTVFFCETHGVFSRRYNLLQTKGCQCLKCELPTSGFLANKKGYLYVLDIYVNSLTITGYGITNNYRNRLITHKRNLKSVGATITNIQVFEGSGTAVLAVENAIKSLHTTGLLDCEGFRRESISIDRKDEVLEKCKKLKELDNTKDTL